MTSSRTLAMSSRTRIISGQVSTMSSMQAGTSG